MPLVERRRGSGTRLTPLGDKLVAAEQKLESQLGAHLQALSQELEAEINQLLPNRPSVISVHSNHGFAGPRLEDLSPDFQHVSDHNSPCDLFTMQLPRTDFRTASLADYKRWLTPNVHRVISFVTREMA